jgi:hypothetical protein
MAPAISGARQPANADADIHFRASTTTHETGPPREYLTRTHVQNEAEARLALLRKRLADSRPCRPPFVANANVVNSRDAGLERGCWRTR